MSEEFKRQRNTCLQILRSLGYGKHNIEKKIQEEATHLMDILRSLDGKPFDPAPTLMISVSNVICSMLYGQRYDHSDQEYQHLLQIVREMIPLFSKKWREIMSGCTDSNQAIKKSWRISRGAAKVWLISTKRKLTNVVNV